MRTWFFFPGGGVKELILGVGDAAEIGIYGGRLGAVCVPGALDEGVAAVDLPAGHLAEIPALGSEDVLLLDLVAEEL
jgi:hypothetical protein